MALSWRSGCIQIKSLNKPSDREIVRFCNNATMSFSYDFEAVALYMFEDPPQLPGFLPEALSLYECVMVMRLWVRMGRRCRAR
jgi:hypothetical protein